MVTEVDDEEPTVTPASRLRSQPSGTIRARHTSSRHTSTTPSQHAFGWRTSTPSLASDRGVATTTDDEIETELFDETETEVVTKSLFRVY